MEGRKYEPSRASSMPSALAASFSHMKEVVLTQTIGNLAARNIAITRSNGVFGKTESADQSRVLLHCESRSFTFCRMKNSLNLFDTRTAESSAKASRRTLSTRTADEAGGIFGCDVRMNTRDEAPVT
jgi:hypothetical protein